MSPLPNFFLIGAARSGTTSLYNYLRHHPQVFMSPVKETNFFAFEVQTRPFIGPTASYLAKTAIVDFEEYQGLFAGAKSAVAIGEASPRYIFTPGVPEAIFKRVPQARLIAILRDPVERAYRSYLGNLRDGWEPASSFIEAVRDEERRERENWASAVLLRPGYYHRHLTRYLDVFPKEQLRIYLFEDLKSDALGLGRDIFRFLGVDDDFVPDVAEQHNPTGVIENPLLRWIWRTPPGPREFIRSRLPKAVEKAVYGLLKRNLVKPDITDDVRQEVRAIFRQDTLKLQDFLQRDLAGWLGPV